jgi:hypothetical protein
VKISHTAASLIGSAASGLIRAIQSDTGILVPRSAVEERITVLYSGLIKEFIEDENSWERRPMPGKYDVYLEIRKAEGTLSEYDLTRRGLVIEDFTDGIEFNKHNMRVAQSRIKSESDLAHAKECSVCGQIKDRSRFPKSGGSKCKTCVDRNTRENRRNTGS